MFNNLVGLIRGDINRQIGWASANTLIVVVALFPVFWIVMLSLKSPQTLGDGRLIPSSWSFENYKGIFEQNVFTSALVNSIGIALIDVPTSPMASSRRPGFAATIMAG